MRKRYLGWSFRDIDYRNDFFNSYSKTQIILGLFESSFIFVLHNLPSIQLINNMELSLNCREVKKL